MSTNINFDKKLGITGGAGISLPSSAPAFEDIYSYEFDGVDDKIQSTSIFNNLDGQGYVGFSFWVKIPNVASSNTQLLRLNNSVSGYSFNLYVRTNGTIDASFTSSSSFTRSNSNAITSNNWHHIFVRFNGSISSRYSRLRIFVDGLLNHASSNFGNYTTFRTNSSDLFIATNNTSVYSNIYINELAFYTSGNDTLPNEIYNGGTANNLDDNTFTPISWYREENATWSGSEWTITDKMGIAPNLITRNMAEASRVTDVPPNPFTNTKSILLDGVDDYVDIGAPSNLNSVTTMSISCWFKTTLSTGVLVGADDQSLGRRFILLLNSSKARFLYFNASQSYYFSDGTTSVNDGNWHHVVSVLDGTSIKVYVDGVLEGTATGVGNMNANINTPINIGRRSYASSKLAFQGNIDETSIFNTALTQSEVTSIYNGGVPNNLNDLSNAPLSWWRCGDGDTSPTLTDNGSGGNDGTMTNFSTFSTDVPT